MRCIRTVQLSLALHLIFHEMIVNAIVYVRLRWCVC